MVTMERESWTRILRSKHPNVSFSLITAFLSPLLHLQLTEPQLYVRSARLDSNQCTSAENIAFARGTTRANSSSSTKDDPSKEAQEDDKKNKDHEKGQH